MILSSSSSFFLFWKERDIIFSKIFVSELHGISQLVFKSTNSHHICGGCSNKFIIGEPNVSFTGILFLLTLWGFYMKILICIRDLWLSNKTCCNTSALCFPMLQAQGILMTPNAGVLNRANHFYISNCEGFQNLKLQIWYHILIVLLWL